MHKEEGGDHIAPGTGFRSNMEFPVVNEVRAYWEALRAGRQVPLRSEVDPRGIERALEHAFVLERIAPQVARFRLAGMHLNDLMGMEVRGMPLTAFFAPSGRDKVAQILEGVFKGPEMAELSIAGETGFGRPPIEGRLLILPLKSDLGDVSRALGCLVTSGQIGRRPRRFEMAEARITRIEAGRPLEAANRLTALPGMAEARAEFEPAPRSAKNRGHLRLVKSDE
jgi:hypothetical protein